MNEPTEAQLAAATLEKFKDMPFTGAELQTAVAIHNWLQSKMRPQLATEAGETDDITKT